MKCQDAWSASWNQDCCEKYQQPQICTWYNFNERKWRVMKEPLEKGERGGWKAGLKLNIQKTKIMASSPITSWQLDGEKVETVTDLIFLGSIITVDGDYSHKIKRCLHLGRKAMKNLGSILKSRDITLLTKACIVKVVMCGCWELVNKGGWVLKKWCFQTFTGEDLENTLDSKDIKSSQS